MQVNQEFRVILGYDHSMYAGLVHRGLGSIPSIKIQAWRHIPVIPELKREREGEGLGIHRVILDYIAPTRPAWKRKEGRKEKRNGGEGGDGWEGEGGMEGEGGEGGRGREGRTDTINTAGRMFFYGR